MPEKGEGSAGGQERVWAVSKTRKVNRAAISYSNIHVSDVYLCGLWKGGCNNNHADNKWPRMFVCVSSNTYKQMHRAGLNHLLTFSFFKMSIKFIKS